MMTIVPREGARASRCFWGGLVAGLILGAVGVARAKLQCPSSTNVGRRQAALPLSARMGDQSIPLPSLSEAPALGQLVFKTEFDAYPDLVHVEAFDPNASPPARILHLSRAP